MKIAQRVIAGCLILAAVLCLSGCGVSHRSPEGVVKSLIKAYGKGSIKQAAECYGTSKKEMGEGLQKEIEAVLRYLDAHKQKKIRILECGKISQDKDAAYVYITYNLVLEDGQEYPCIGTYMTSKGDGKKYNIIEPSEITEDLSTWAARDYVQFMTSDAYKEYRRTYDTFVKKNPGYEDKITERLTE